MSDPTEVRRKLTERSDVSPLKAFLDVMQDYPASPENDARIERLHQEALAMAESGAYIPPPPSRVSPAPPISTIAGTSVMITPQQRYEFRLDFGKRISYLTLTERDALELIQRLRQSIAAARKAQQVTP